MLRPKLGLPPLPPRQILPKYVLAKSWTIASGAHERDYPNRSAIANTQLADDFVRAIKLRKDEFVLDMYGGIGYVTRSMLSGGRQSSPLQQAREKAAWWKELKDKAPETPEGAAKPIVPEDIFPNWIETFKDAEAELEALEQDPFEVRRAEEEETATVHKAKHVVVADPNTRLRKVSYALDPSTKPLPHQEWEWIMSQKTSETTAWLEGILPCAVDDRVSTTGADPYTWETAEYMLSHPDTRKNLPITRPTAPAGPEQNHRDWTDPEPHITYVAQMPLSLLADALINQWLSSAVGAADGYPTWIWRWGRVRLALLMSRWSYDRLTARAGELSRNKNSVVAEALYHITPLPPYHHVPNVDRGSTAIEAQPPRFNQNSAVAKRVMDAYKTMDMPRTTFKYEDAFPPVGPKTIAVHDRPPILGVMLEPRLRPVMTMEQADEWDYVLRHMFVLQAQTVEVALPLLGFNAISLLKDIAGENNGFAGAPTSPNAIIRDLEVDEWARIVDVFSNWPFKPTNLAMDRDLGEGDLFDPFKD